MNKSYNILFLFCLLTALAFLTNAQGSNKFENAGSSQQIESPSLAFKEIEKGISEGKVSAISDFFSSQIYLSLSNGVNGYYSSNQAYYVLQRYFKDYHVISFSIENIHDEDESVYAIGVYSYSFEGKDDKAQVYISLKPAGKKWKITQLTID